jgi:hypothetical protein
MSEFCGVCKRHAKQACSCDLTLRFCSKDYIRHQKLKLPGEHEGIDLVDRRNEIRQKYKLILENINRAKNITLSRSTYLIQAILEITDYQLSLIQKNINLSDNLIKSRDISSLVDKTLQDFGNIESRGADLSEFSDIVKSYLRLFINGNEIDPPTFDIEKNKEFEKKVTELEVKVKILEDQIEKFKSSPKKTYQEIIDDELKFEKLRISTNDVNSAKELLKADFELFLEGHTSYVNSVAVTSDNKYIISGSKDKTIRVWNLLEKRQEHFIENLENMKSLTIENNNLVIHFDDGSVQAIKLSTLLNH